MDYASKPKITKIVQAIDAGQSPNLYAAVRGADDALRVSLWRFLALNPVPGGAKARELLSDVTNPATAVRSAAVWLMLNNER